MSERKAIGRYYPPDVDPSNVKFSSKTKKTSQNKSQSVRLMVPFSLKCLKCNEYIAQSRKFNARKELTDRDYLGIKIIRFNIRCPRCFSELIYETDPKNGDYQCIDGCKRNYERPKEVKNNETIDEMVIRLEKEMQEDEKMQELKRKGGNNLRNGLISDETGMEQLEKRLAEQQKEQERIEELENLQLKMATLENRRIEIGENADSRLQNENDTDLDQEAKDAFTQFRKTETNVIKESVNVVSGYSSSSDSSSSEQEQDQEQDQEKEQGSEGKASILLKRTQDSVHGVMKRKKRKIIT